MMTEDKKKRTQCHPSPRPRSLNDIMVAWAGSRSASCQAHGEMWWLDPARQVRLSTEKIALEGPILRNAWHPAPKDVVDAGISQLIPHPNSQAVQLNTKARGK